jgi:hypothetical protein
MPLTLKIVSKQRHILGADSVRVFSVHGGSIGRSPDSDWVLPDPDRYISGHHATIDYRDGAYYLRDTSTNGVFVNRSDQAVGRGARSGSTTGTSCAWAITCSRSASSTSAATARRQRRVGGRRVAAENPAQAGRPLLALPEAARRAGRRGRAAGGPRRERGVRRHRALRRGPDRYQARRRPAAGQRAPPAGFRDAAAGRRPAAAGSPADVHRVRPARFHRGGAAVARERRARLCADVARRRGEDRRAHGPAGALQRPTGSSRCCAAGAITRRSSASARPASTPPATIRSSS